MLIIDARYDLEDLFTLVGYDLYYRQVNPLTYLKFLPKGITLTNVARQYYASYAFFGDPAPDIWGKSMDEIYTQLFLYAKERVEGFDPKDEEHQEAFLNVMLKYCTREDPYAINYEYDSRRGNYPDNLKDLLKLYMMRGIDFPHPITATGEKFLTRYELDSLVAEVKGELREQGLWED